jgi:hypothetical protein
MAEEPDIPDVVTLTGHGGFYNGERYDLPAGTARTAGRAETASFPVTRTRNYRRLAAPRRPDALLALLAPEHVRFLHVGAGRLFVENVSGGGLLVDGRPVAGQVELDLARAAAEIAFGPGETLRAALPGSPPPPPRAGEPALPDWFGPWLDGGPSVAPARPEYRLEPHPVAAAAVRPEDSPAPAAATTKTPPTARSGRLKSGFPWLLSALLHTVVVLALLVLAVTTSEPPPPGHVEFRIVPPEDWSPAAPAPPAPETATEETDERAEPATAMEDLPPPAGDGGPAPPGPAGEDAGFDGEAAGAAGSGTLPGPGSLDRPAGGAGRASGKPSPPGDDPVSRGLAWLARHQLADGSFGGVSSLRTCGCGGAGQRDYRVALTGLSALAFLGAGSTHRDGPYREELARALRFLVAEQREDGGFFPAHAPEAERETYGNAIAALAIAEADRLAPSALLKVPLDRAVSRFERTQIAYGGWRYKPADTAADTSVTGWVALALVAAERAGSRPQNFTRIGTLAWIDSMTDPETGWTGYRRRGHGSLAMAATGLAVRLLLGERRVTTAVRAGRALLASNLPAWPEGSGAAAPSMPDLYYVWFGTLASRASGGEHWRLWNSALQRALRPRQVAKGEAAGSWPPTGRWEKIGGRILSTALALLCLETAGPYPSAFR